MATKQCGCEDVDEFAALLDVPDEDATDTADPRGTKLTRWRGLVAPYGKPTGDKRRFKSGSLTARELPIPVKWQRTDSQGHSTSVVVGTMEGVEYSDDGVYAWGIMLDPDREVLPRLAEDVAEARLLMESRAIGPSVDLDDMEFHALDPEAFAANPEERPEIEVTKGRISAVTLVQIPAFAEARPFELDEIDAADFAAGTLTAGGYRSDWLRLPVAELDDWSPGYLTHTQRLTPSLLAGAWLYDDGDRQAFPVADVVDGKLAVIPEAVRRCIAVFAQQGDRLDLPAEDLPAIRGALSHLAVHCGIDPPPWAAELPAALVAGAAVPALPDGAWFADPQLAAPTPLTITEDGRVFGHVAAWKTCHIGFPGACVTPPKSRSKYAFFHLGEVETTAGLVPVGKITLGGGHADTRLGFQAALEHYDNSTTAVARVRAGDDKFGIWVAGVVVPGLSPERLAELRASPPSGDWRRVAGDLEMIGAHAVNTPGFPIPRAFMQHKQQLSLVAAGAIVPGEPAAEDDEERRRTQGRELGHVFAVAVAQADTVAAQSRAYALAQTFM